MSILYSILFVLALGFDRAVLYGNVAISILKLLTKKQYSSFFKKAYVFQEISFKVKTLKTFKITSESHIETYRSLKRRTILKIHSTVFYTNLRSFCWL